MQSARSERLTGRKTLRGALVFAATLALQGCADYLNNRDTVTLGAGNAMEANVGIHAINPFPPHADDVYIAGDGVTVARAQRIYRRGLIAPQTAQGEAGAGE